MMFILLYFPNKTIGFLVMVKKVLLILITLLSAGCEVAIIGGIGIPTYYSYVRKGYATEAKTQMKNIVQASEIYKMENDSYPPDCWETLKEEDYLEIKNQLQKNGNLNVLLMMKMVKVELYLRLALKKWVEEEEI